MPVIGGGGSGLPVQTLTPVVSVNSQPTQDSAIDMSFRLRECIVTSQAHDLPRCVFERDYGKVKQPYQGDLVAAVPPLDLLGQWATVRLIGLGGMSEPVFIGQITNEVRDIHGSGSTTGATGKQVLTAFGPFQLLLKSTVDHAIYDDGVSGVTGLSQSFNSRDATGMLFGNRSAAEVGGTFVFGGTDIWTRRQALAYLLENFTGQDFGGFEWSVAGDTGFLDLASDVVEVGGSQSVGSVVRSILSPQAGMDFTVELQGAGFEIRVFSLALDSHTYQGITIPRNPRRIGLNVSDRVDLTSTMFSRSIDQRYSRIIVRGGRVVIAFSLRGPSGDLVKKWAAADETAYIAGTGTPSDLPMEHDRARKVDALEAVYQVLGAPDGYSLSASSAAIELNEDGSISGDGGQHQSKRRSTLPYVPLRKNTDYSSGDPVDNSPAGYEASFRRPELYLLNESTNRYVRASRVGIEVSPSDTDWGLEIASQPQHRVALNSFTGDTLSRPRYDYQKGIATIAVELDTRLTLEITRDEGDGTTIELEAPGAELWVIAAGTVTGIDKNGNLEQTSKAIEVRNDKAALDAVMATAQARYFEERTRAVITVQGIPEAWSNLVGQILTSVQQGGHSLDVGAPITSVTYALGERPTTRIQAGHAR